jgi:hypothetical protein
MVKFHVTKGCTLEIICNTLAIFLNKYTVNFFLEIRGMMMLSLLMIWTFVLFPDFRLACSLHFGMTPDSY